MREEIPKKHAPPKKSPSCFIERLEKRSLRSCDMAVHGVEEGEAGGLDIMVEDAADIDFSEVFGEYSLYVEGDNWVLCC